MRAASIAGNIDYWLKGLTVLAVCASISRFLELYPTFREFDPDDPYRAN